MKLAIPISLVVLENFINRVFSRLDENSIFVPENLMLQQLNTATYFFYNIEILVQPSLPFPKQKYNWQPISVISARNVVFDFRNMTGQKFFLQVRHEAQRVSVHSCVAYGRRQMTGDRYARCTPFYFDDAIGINSVQMITMEYT